MENHHANNAVYTSATQLNAIVMTNLGAGDELRVFLADAKAPRGITFDAAGNLYFAEYGSQRVRVIDDSGVKTFATGLRYPRGLAIDSAGNIYVADAGSDTIKVIDQQGRVRDFTHITKPDSLSLQGDKLIVSCGEGTIGKFSLNGEGGAFHKLPRPSSGTAMDAQGNIYVTTGMDQHNRSQMSKIDAQGRESIIMTSRSQGNLFTILGFSNNGYLLFSELPDTITIWKSREDCIVRSCVVPAYSATTHDFVMG
ncbi:hypothetical protein [Undibacterium sp. TJN19]|uniref:hypothetical protein n=1 Tax=Undibacterium sp. TJN19 TaxID=3413055 RepID=UPI003BF226D6